MCVRVLLCCCYFGLCCESTIFVVCIRVWCNMVDSASVKCFSVGLCDIRSLDCLMWWVVMVGGMDFLVSVV